VGALQVLAHPYNDYVGWTLIWVAIIGAVALGVYHVATTVESPRYHPKIKPSPMTPAEAGFLTALGATAISLIALGLRHRSIAAIAALIACLAVAFDFVDRQWFSAPMPSEVPLTTENARIDFRLEPIWRADQKQFFMNYHEINNGTAMAFETGHVAYTSTATGLIDPDLINAMFITLRSKIRPVRFPRDEMTVGQNDQFFSIPDTPNGLQFDENTFPAAQKGSLLVYIFLIMKYRDDVIPPTKSIYTERCLYMVGAVAHNCESGHNRSYISD